MGEEFLEATRTALPRRDAIAHEVGVAQDGVELTLGRNTSVEGDNPLPSTGEGAGSLTVVGLGIALGHVTAQTLGVLEAADIVLAAVGDPALSAFLSSHCAEVENLTSAYEEGKLRSDIYDDMAERVLQRVREGRRVCLAVYGHPGVLVTAAHWAIRTARAEGYAARMLPAVSADACMFADLEMDPGDRGIQCYEAGAFLRDGKSWDKTSYLVLWQIVAVGDAEHWDVYQNRRLPDLLEKLSAAYGPTHQATIYEAPTLPWLPPRIDRLPLNELPLARLTTASTLLIEPS